MNSPDPSLEEIVSSLTELKQLADVQGLNKIDDLIDLVMIVAIDKFELEAETVEASQTEYRNN